MKKYLIQSAKIALILVYLVILAGALVRMTGSGMGCPDWPKCFGYYIPPTEKATLLWSPNRDFKAGQVIIVNEKLWVAKQNFTSGNKYNENNFEPFTKHDYAEFNVTKTWIEYINRLIGAIAGLACFIMALLSFYHWKQNKKVVLFSWFVVFLMGFQGWLGATVVYSVLNPLKITIHMVMALIIVAFILYIIKIARPQENKITLDPLFRNILFISLILTLIQIILGTQVRQFVDEQIKMGISNKTLWLAQPEVNFYVHRSFSILVVLTNSFLLFRNQKLKLGLQKINWVITLLIIEVISGIAMYYLDFPVGSQAIHLIIASILFGFQFYLILETKKNSI
jgi:heme a synthase